MASIPVIAAQLSLATPSITLQVHAQVVNHQLAKAAEILARQLEDVAWPNAL
ncbi:hypothetical protein GCM10010182_83640 [Actinomadura cremea]|nr:hypothetical protein GCM10010182_83640 [Actinomadura cremea]